MMKPRIDELHTKEPRALTPQMSGDLLAEIKRLARERYSQLFGTDADFERLWRSAFFITENSNNETHLTSSVQEIGEKG